MSVKEIIDWWDPIDLLMHAPGNEYHSEIDAVENLLKTTKDCEEIAVGIYAIFIRAFGKDVFIKTKQECAEIAKKILDFV